MARGASVLMCLIGHKARDLTSGRVSGTQVEGVGIPVDSRIEIYGYRCDARDGRESLSDQPTGGAIHRQHGDEAAWDLARRVATVGGQTATAIEPAGRGAANTTEIERGPSRI